MEKESAAFVCEVSHDEVECQWYKGSTKLKAGENIKMRQEGTTPKNPGKITRPSTQDTLTELNFSYSR